MINKIPNSYFQELLEKLLDERTGFDNQWRRARVHTKNPTPQPHKEPKRTNARSYRFAYPN
ncbi:hypothetical protein O9929_02140 [Vibrio lentus]|nr:hypothetical protein [Vibrio lentus]